MKEKIIYTESPNKDMWVKNKKARDGYAQVGYKIFL